MRIYSNISKKYLPIHKPSKCIYTQILAINIDLSTNPENAYILKYKRYIFTYPQIKKMRIYSNIIGKYLPIHTPSKCVYTQIYLTNIYLSTNQENAYILKYKRPKFTYP